MADKRDHLQEGRKSTLLEFAKQYIENWESLTAKAKRLPASALEEGVNLSAAFTATNSQLWNTITAPDVFTKLWNALTQRKLIGEWLYDSASDRLVYFAESGYCFGVMLGKDMTTLQVTLNLRPDANNPALRPDPGEQVIIAALNINYASGEVEMIHPSDHLFFPDQLLLDFLKMLL